MNKTLVMHPAVSMPFSELCAGLQAAVAAGTVNMSVNGNLALFNYSKDCQFNHSWDAFTILARGLILDTVAQRIVALCFPKFHNATEPEGVKVVRFDAPFEAFTKLDGSLAVVYHYNGDWHVATRGSFNSAQAAWAQDWLYSNKVRDALNPCVTYLMEIIYPENKIVIKYDFSGLVLLSAYETATGRELDYHTELKPLADNTGLRITELVPFASFAEAAEYAEKLPGSQEGFVIRFCDTGDRVKIKGETYRCLHKMISNCTPLGIWELMCKNYDMESYKASMPEEFTEEISSIVQHFDSKCQETLARVVELYSRYAGCSDKELGLAVNTGELKGVEGAGMLFPLRKKGADNVKALILKGLRPTGNKIPGYVPSTNLLRAQTEE